LLIDGVKYCEDFHHGHQKNVNVPFGISAPTASPVENTCSSGNLHTLVLHTQVYGIEITWDLVGVENCDSHTNAPYGDYNTYSTDCCVSDGSYELICEDTYGDGWHGAFLMIDGNKYCEQFLQGSSMTDVVTFANVEIPQPQVDSSSPTSLPTSLPTTLPSQSPSTAEPTQAPSTAKPSSFPSQSPSTTNPTQAPSTNEPSSVPTQAPSTSQPSSVPNQSPVTSGSNTGDQCTDYTIELHTSVWASEISWHMFGSWHCNAYGWHEDGQVHTTDCCLDDGMYTLKCMDSFGDGWHGAYLLIDGIKYCEDFTDGSYMQEKVPLGISGAPTTSPTTAPTRLPVENTCPSGSNLHTLEMHTAIYGDEISWNFLGVEDCDSDGANYESDSLYTTNCCIPSGQHTLMCNDSYGDGWHGAYMLIDGTKYCEDFHDGPVMSVVVDL